MDVVIHETRWHGFDALAMEYEGLRVIVVPETGGRIVSLFDTEHGFEWLLAPEGAHPYRKLDYGTDFNSQTPGGWDDMFPTILAEPYPVPGKFQGTPLPDHGEVWTMPWAAEIRPEGEISMSVVGQALPYRLARRLAAARRGYLALRYELTNLGDAPLHYLWAAHPQFACPPGTRIVLPDEVKEVVNVLPLEWGKEWGPPGTRNAWPHTLGPDSKVRAQNNVGAPALRRGRKFYMLPEQPIGWAGLVEPAGASLHLEWQPAALPYCGVWIDEGVLNPVASVAIEPTSAYYDTLAIAWRNQRLAVVEPGARQTWELAVRLGQATSSQ